MIKKESYVVAETKTKIVAVECDVCGREFLEDSNSDDVFEIQEFTHIKFTGGYGSIFGDGDVFELDICQHCLKEKLGVYFREVIR